MILQSPIPVQGLNLQSGGLVPAVFYPQEELLCSEKYKLFKKLLEPIAQIYYFFPHQRSQEQKPELRHTSAQLHCLHDMKIRIQIPLDTYYFTYSGVEMKL